MPCVFVRDHHPGAARVEQYPDPGKHPVFGPGREQVPGLLPRVRPRPGRGALPKDHGDQGGSAPEDQLRDRAGPPYRQVGRGEPEGRLIQVTYFALTTDVPAEHDRFGKPRV